MNLWSGRQEPAARHPTACTLRVYDGVFHGVEHEPEKHRIFTDVAGWMHERLAD